MFVKEQVRLQQLLVKEREEFERRSSELDRKNAELEMQLHEDRKNLVKENEKLYEQSKKQMKQINELEMLLRGKQDTSFECTKAKQKIEVVEHENVSLKKEFDRIKSDLDKQAYSFKSKVNELEEIKRKQIDEIRAKENDLKVMYNEKEEVLTAVVQLQGKNVYFYNLLFTY